jgi:hypothetical protein
MVYGGRIAALKDAVAKGDFDAVADEKSAFVLFNSGAYPTAKAKADKAAAIEGTNKIFAAIRSGDKGALKSAYDSYVKENDISPIPNVDPDKGQGYASDFSYLAKTRAAYVIYILSIHTHTSIVCCSHTCSLFFLTVPSMSGKFFIPGTLPYWAGRVVPVVTMLHCCTVVLAMGDPE